MEHKDGTKYRKITNAEYGEVDNRTRYEAVKEPNWNLYMALVALALLAVAGLIAWEFFP